MNSFAGTKSKPSCDWHSILEYLGVLGPPKRPGSKMWETQPTGWSSCRWQWPFMTPWHLSSPFVCFIPFMSLWHEQTEVPLKLHWTTVVVISCHFFIFLTLSYFIIPLLCFIEALRLLRQRSRGGGAEGSLNSSHSGPRVAGRYRVSKGEWKVVDFWLGQHGNSRSLLGQPVSKQHQVTSNQIYIKSQSQDQSLSIFKTAMGLFLTCFDLQILCGPCYTWKMLFSLQC